MKKTLFFILIGMLANNGYAQVCGCTDPLASNYNANATVNDGSCRYATTNVSFTEIGTLDSRISGSSGMIFWNDNYWTYNDHNNLHLYKLDSLTGNITDSIRIAESGNYDTEEISQDSVYLYFGDFGNNTASRTDLHILRIEKHALLNQTHTIDTIFFSYPDQTVFNTESMQTDFDCEAFVAGTDSLYVFTKQWLHLGTVCYAIPKTPGTYVAVRKDSCHVNGLITGATYFPEKRLMVLCGYSPVEQLVTPFFYLLYDFEGENFFSGNKRKLNTSAMAHQVEAIAGSNATNYYITNEYLSYSFFSIDAQMHRLDLSDFLSNYLSGLNIPADTATALVEFPHAHIRIRVYPNPASDELRVENPDTLPLSYHIYNMQGLLMEKGRIEDGRILLPGTKYRRGSYLLILKYKNEEKTIHFYKL